MDQRKILDGAKNLMVEEELKRIPVKNGNRKKKKERLLPKKKEEEKKKKRS